MESDELMRLLSAAAGWPAADAASRQDLLARAEALARRAAAGSTLAPQADLDRRARDGLLSLYRELPAPSAARGYLLRALALDGSAEALGAFSELLADDPPSEPRTVALALAPLVQRPPEALGALFPRLLDAVAHPQAAAAVLDVANFALRRKLLSRHPAADRAPQLAQLLGAVVGTLAQIEERPEDFGRSPEELRAKVAEAVDLVVALCDTLGLCGDSSAVGKLRQTLELRHRRLRLEAAAALARLEDQEGTAALVRLAADPAARRRALAYLEEVGQLDRVPPEQRTPQARAEGDLADWLAQPLQFGLPPHSLSVVDEKRQYWPGFSAPRDCYLLEYEYRLPGGTLQGVGIVGPVTHALAVDLADLPPADIYAAYAGWHAQHEDIRESDVEELSAEDRAALDALAQQLEQQGFDRVRPELAGQFFGDRAAVFSAERAGQPGAIVMDESGAQWFPRPAASRPPGPREVYCVWKGRKLLEAFNA